MTAITLWPRSLKGNCHNTVASKLAVRLSISRRSVENLGTKCLIAKGHRVRFGEHQSSTMIRHRSQKDRLGLDLGSLPFGQDTLSYIYMCN